MSKIHNIFILTALFAAQQCFAAEVVDKPEHDSISKPCSVVVNACIEAGFGRTEVVGKRIWLDCMKPIILGKTVNEVSVDASSMQICRADKIKELKSELKEIEESMSTAPNH